MAHPNPFVDHVLDLLAPLGPVRARAMFGGYGLYADDRMLGLVAADRLYLKADERTRATFEAAGCQPFTYEGRGKPVVMQYFEPPEETLDDAEAILSWARMALDAARRAPAPVRKRRRPAA
jgi:DNA transformation protein and related proteins